MTRLIFTATLALVLCPLSASAQKRDIRGIQPGMAASDLIEKMKSMDANCGPVDPHDQPIFDLRCQLFFEQFNRGGRTVNNMFLLKLSKYLNSPKVLRVDYMFYSERNYEDIKQQISNEFRGTWRVQRDNWGEYGSWDLGDGYTLTFGKGLFTPGPTGGYHLYLQNVDLEEADEIAGKERR
jgi:hypothetical protein